MRRGSPVVISCDYGRETEPWLSQRGEAVWNAVGEKECRCSCSQQYQQLLSQPLGSQLPQPPFFFRLLHAKRKIVTVTTARAVQVCQSFSMSHLTKSMPTWYTISAAAAAKSVMNTNCPIAHFHDPASRATTALVGRHWRA